MQTSPERRLAVEDGGGPFQCESRTLKAVGLWRACICDHDTGRGHLGVRSLVTNLRITPAIPS